MFTTIISISLGAILTNNFIFSQFLGCCPFLGCSNKVDTATGMGLAVVFVMGLASAICWVVNEYILVALELEFLQTLTFILVIAALVQLVEIILKKYSPALHKSLGVYLPLITTNCGVLGVTMNNISDGFNFIESILTALGCGLGFLMAMVIFSGVRQKVEEADPPESFKGLPITLINAGIVSLAFFGFTGVITNLFG